MTRDQAAKAIAAAMAEAVGTTHNAYWSACDAEDRAIDIDPADLGAPEGLLDEAYRAALLVKSLVAKRGISWAKASELVKCNLSVRPRTC